MITFRKTDNPIPKPKKIPDFKPDHSKRRKKTSRSESLNLSWCKSSPSTTATAACQIWPEISCKLTKHLQERIDFCFRLCCCYCYCCCCCCWCQCSSKCRRCCCGRRGQSRTCERRDAGQSDLNPDSRDSAFCWRIVELLNNLKNVHCPNSTIVEVNDSYDGNVQWWESIQRVRVNW